MRRDRGFLLSFGALLLVGLLLVPAGSLLSPAAASPSSLLGAVGAGTAPITPAPVPSAPVVEQVTVSGRSVSISASGDPSPAEGQPAAGGPVASVLSTSGNPIAAAGPPGEIGGGPLGAGPSVQFGVDSSVKVGGVSANGIMLPALTVNPQDLVVVASTAFGSYGNVSSVSSFPVLKWTRYTAASSSSPLQFFSVWYAEPSSSVSLRIRVDYPRTLGVAPYESILALAISGANGSQPFDTGSVRVVTAPTSNVAAGPTIATAAGGELVLSIIGAHYGNSANNNVGAAGNGYTLNAFGIYNASGHGVVSEASSALENASGSYTPNYTFRTHTGMHYIFLAAALRPATVPLTFHETGLPSGTPWAVTVNGVTSPRSSQPSLTVPVPNGTLAYNVSDVPGWRANRYAGTVTVNGPTNGPTIAFTRAVYPVNFTETGLSGEAWAVTFNGTLSPETTASTIDVGSFPNGSYLYNISAVSGLVPSPSSGTVVVVGSSASVPVSFAVPTTSVTFTESNLPTGASWTLWFNSTIGGPSYSGTSTGTSLVLRVAHSTYRWVAKVAGGRGAGASGSGVVVPTTTSVSVVFPTQSVTATPLNLPGALPWQIWLNLSPSGSYHASSTGGSIVLSVVNGSYAWSARTQSAPSVGRAVGTVTVTSTTSLSVPFPAYVVTFTQSALPPGTHWQAWLNQTLGSYYVTGTGASLSVSVINGTYAWKALYFGEGTVAPPSGSGVVIAGSGTTITASFPTGNTGTFQHNYMSSSPRWVVWLNSTTAGGPNYTANGTGTTLSVSNVLAGTYRWIAQYAGEIGPLPNGTLTATQYSVPYTSVTFPGPATVTFSQVGLSGTYSWTVWMNATAPGGTDYTQTVSYASFSFTSVPYANYTWTAVDAGGFPPFPSGYVLVASPTVTVAANFSAFTHTETFMTPSLPAGTSWTVWLNGTGSTSGTYTATGTTGSLLIHGVRSGTYAWVAAYAGFVGTKPSAAITITGNLTVKVVFGTATVTVAPSGFPSGLAWEVWLNGSVGPTLRYFANGSSATLSIPSVLNGSYTATVAWAG
ncbi:MAG: hypothetical protein QXG65_01540, partial [Thermoplasmata archaeon]